MLVALRKLPFAMRLGIICAILGTLAIVGSYVLAFRSGHLSSETSDWGDFGSYLAGTVGSLLSLLSVGAVLFSSARQMKAAKASELFDDIQPLGQSISSCQSANLGTGHAYFGALGEELWDSYIRVTRNGYSDGWETARGNLVQSDAANWASVRGEIRRLLGMIGDTKSLSDSQCHEAMARIQTLFTPGIALLLVVDSHLDGSANIIAMAERHGLFRSIDPQIRDSLLSGGLCKEPAFN